MAAFHYIVRAKLIRRIKENGEIEFLQIEEKFENENPIIARNLAFRFYQNHVDVFLQSKEQNYYSDKQAKEELKSFIDPGTSTIFKLGDSEIEYSDSYGNGLGVFLIVDIPLFSDEIGEELLIHDIGNLIHIGNNPNFLISELDREYDYYISYNYDTENKVIDIVFCNSDEWGEGYLGNGEWLESYGEPNSHKILETPFDWTGLDKPYWWGYSETKETPKAEKYIEDIIQEGETNQIEFKPSLLYNFLTKKAGIGVKGHIAKAICAFLNSNGGYLIIGITDKGETQGLSYDFSLSGEKNEKDFFMLEFDQMLEYFLSFSVKSNVSGQFFQIDDKDIFAVTVIPSKSRPIFLKGQNGKEFYVRGEASSRQISDNEELVNYCIEKWGQNN